jgi:hypothetical protein
MLQRDTISTDFSAIRAAAQRRIISIRCTAFTHLPVSQRQSVVKLRHGRLGRPPSQIGTGYVYRIVRVSGRSSERLDERSRAVIAAGFFNAAEARECALRWVRRHCPEATYLPDSDRWRLQDDDGSIHLFCVEPSAASSSERNAA